MNQVWVLKGFIIADSTEALNYAYILQESKLAESYSLKLQESDTSMLPSLPTHVQQILFVVSEGGIIPLNNQVIIIFR